MGYVKNFLKHHFSATFWKGVGLIFLIALQICTVILGFSISPAWGWRILGANVFFWFTCSGVTDGNGVSVNALKWATFITFCVLVVLGVLWLIGCLVELVLPPTQEPSIESTMFFGFMGIVVIGIILGCLFALLHEGIWEGKWQKPLERLFTCFKWLVVLALACTLVWAFATYLLPLLH